MKQLKSHLRPPPAILYDQPLPTTAYLINTSKVFKGSKLKTQDFIKLQLLKYRHCSPNQLNALPEPPFALVDKTRIFEQVANEEELRRKIKMRRENESHQTKKRMKFFNNGKDSQQAPEDTDTGFNYQLSVGPKEMTSYSSKRTSSSKNYSLHQGVSYDLRANLPEKKVERSLQFRSDNLGKKKNEYLNTIGLGEGEQRSRTAYNPAGESQGRDNERLTISRKKSTNSYMRQWKKYFKVKMEVQKEEDLTPFNSQCLAESVEKQVNRDDGVKINNWRLQAPSFYSMDIRTKHKQGSLPNGFLPKQGNDRHASKQTAPVTKR